MNKQFLPLLALLCCLLAIGFAQQPAPPAAGGVQIQPAAPALAPRPAPTPEPAAGEGSIHLDVVVTDKTGKPIPGLDLSDFTLVDNNQPGKILSFHAYGGGSAPSSLPVQVILLLDTVNLDITSVSIARGQMEQFLRENGGHLAYPVSIFRLTDDGVGVLNRPTQDGNALASQLEAASTQMREIHRSAGAWGAAERFDLSARMIDEIARTEAKIPGRKLLIWMGPGWPMMDSPNVVMTEKELQGLFANIVELSTRLREARIALYSVSDGTSDSYTFLYKSWLRGVKKAYQANPGDLGLKVLAVQSGGRALDPSNDVASEIANCIQDAAPYYTLSFDSPPADGPNEYHELKVRVDKPGLAARTSTGYYDDPQNGLEP
jgi:VWFA-related protein